MLTEACPNALIAIGLGEERFWTPLLNFQRNVMDLLRLSLVMITIILLIFTEMKEKLMKY